MTNKIITILSLYKLHNKNIICFDNSRLDNSGDINIIFFNKTGLLCQDSFEFNGYHPRYINNVGRSSKRICFGDYLRNHHFYNIVQKLLILLIFYYIQVYYLCKNLNNQYISYLIIVLIYFYLLHCKLINFF